jgi:hypothetical protein
MVHHDETEDKTDETWYGNYSRLLMVYEPQVVGAEVLSTNSQLHIRSLTGHPPEHCPSYIASTRYTIVEWENRLGKLMVLRRDLDQVGSEKETPPGLMVSAENEPCISCLIFQLIPHVVADEIGSFISSTAATIHLSDFWAFIEMAT